MVNTVEREDGVQKPGTSVAAVTYTFDFGTPVSIFHKLSQNSKNGFLFESTEGEGRLARFSFLGVDPLLTVSIKAGTATVTITNGEVIETPVANPVQLLRQALQQYAPMQGRKMPEEFADVPFLGGLVGYMGYGATHYLENIPLQSPDPFNVPEAHYALYDAVFIFDHQYRRVSVISLRSVQHAQGLMDRALAPSVLPPLRLSGTTIAPDEIYQNVDSPFTQETFVDAVKQTKKFIYEGQAFQIVMSQRFSLPVQAEPIDVYRMLTATNPSPYAYFLKCPDFVYLGSSPETFVRCKDNLVTLRAIAGTRPRGQTNAEDERLVEELKSNEKEMAEHRMLVDLGRNDLGRVCTPGTIKVGEIARLTKYTHVMHLETEITGTLGASKTCFDAFQSCFPAGTVSGAPKVRAMQLLSDLEPEQRGIYSGCVGYFDLRGNMDGAIAIRSALIRDGKAHINAGAGIVYDSDPLAEYLETKSKARSLIQAVKLANGVKR